MAEAEQSFGTAGLLIAFRSENLKEEEFKNVNHHSFISL